MEYRRSSSYLGGGNDLQVVERTSGGEEKGRQMHEIFLPRENSSDFSRNLKALGFDLRSLLIYYQGIEGRQLDGAF